MAQEHMYNEEPQREGSSQQKAVKSPTFEQRLILAIISFILFIIMIFAVIVVRFATLYGSGYYNYNGGRTFVQSLLLIGLFGFFLALATLNIIFNRSRLYVEGKSSHYSRSSYGEKLSGQETDKSPTFSRRLILAIGSFVLMMIMVLVVAGVGFATLQGGDYLNYDSILTFIQPLLLIGLMGFFLALIALNIVINLRRR